MCVQTQPGEVNAVRGSLGNENSHLACSKEMSPLDLVSMKCGALPAAPFPSAERGITPRPGRGARAEVSSGSSQRSCSLAELIGNHLVGNFGTDASSDTASLG